MSKRVVAGELREEMNRNRRRGEADKYHKGLLLIRGEIVPILATDADLRRPIERAMNQPEDRPKTDAIRQAKSVFKVIFSCLALAVIFTTQTGCSLLGVARVMEPPMSKTDLAEIAANTAPGQSSWVSYSTASVQPDRLSEIGNDGTLTPAAAMELISFGQGVGKDAAEIALAEAIRKNRSADVVMYVGDHAGARDSFVAFQAAKLKPGTVILSVGNNLSLTSPALPITDAGPIVITVPTNVAVIATNPPADEVDDPAPPPDKPAGILTPADGAVPFDPGDVPQAKNPVDYRGMEVVPVLASAKIEGGGLRYDGMPPRDWWVSGPGLRQPTQTHVRMHIAWIDSGGKVQGGHWDWMRVDQGGFKTTANIRNGYLGARPQPGAVLYVWWIDQQKTRRTNIVRVEGVWS